MTQVTCTAGTFRGVNNGSSSTFFSIPYCSAPPFEHSSPLSPTDLAALAAPETTAAFDCTTPKAFDDAAVCALTVTCPNPIRQLGDAPVVAFIHGGRYEEGSHDGSWYQGQAFAESGCVYVSIGYRLGLNGWATFHDDEPNTYRGVEDCQLALEWIQKNIEAFGGDPTNVTLVGQSAGAAIALWLSRKDHFRGAFRRVVACSPGFPRQPFSARKKTLRTALGTPVTREKLKNLYANDPAKLAKGYAKFRRRYITDAALGPSGFDARELADVPILLTHMRDEFLNDPIATKLDRANVATLAAYFMAKGMGIDNGAKGTRLDKTTNYIQRAKHMPSSPAGRVAGRMVGDSTIRRWVAETAENAPGKVWLLEFIGDVDTPALHCAELPLLFQCLDVKPDRVRRLLPQLARGNDGREMMNHVADVLHHEIVRFARKATPEWNPYEEPAKEERTLSLVDGSWGTVRNPLYGVIEAWLEEH